MGLSFTKLFSLLFAKKEMKILFVGLDAAGKTTILYKLKLGEIVETVPTIGFTVETMEYKDINFIAWDLGAYQTRSEPLWRHLFKDAHGLIFVIDSGDRERLIEARDVLQRMLNVEELRDTVLLVYANKQDLPHAMTATEITEKLDLHSIRQSHWHIESTCATSGEGPYEGLEWLYNTISKKVMLSLFHCMIEKDIVLSLILFKDDAGLMEKSLRTFELNLMPTWRCCASSYLYDLCCVV
ncbi:hypothetical protein RJ639_019610 [Escallonia herrerae]|uniref:ADP-ribosylation factor 1 n=1 Tax=Escallonia herrerae TaxID=1293975 RepID=A0AA88V8B1_9ASTE|nr:hypothetical protein RJ639_019610 [Escallonia herrerae]